MARSRSRPSIDPIDAVDDLHRCVVRSIDRLQEKPRTREDLWKLWAFVRATHDRDDEAKLPSHSKLGKRLGIYRGRLPRLFEILQRIVEACRSGRQAEPALRSEAALTHDQPTPRSLPRGERREAS